MSIHLLYGLTFMCKLGTYALFGRFHSPNMQSLFNTWYINPEMKYVTFLVTGEASPSSYVDCANGKLF